MKTAWKLDSQGQWSQMDVGHVDLNSLRPGATPTACSSSNEKGAQRPCFERAHLPPASYVAPNKDNFYALFPFFKGRG